MKQDSDIPENTALHLPCSSPGAWEAQEVPRRNGVHRREEEEELAALSHSRGPWSNHLAASTVLPCLPELGLVAREGKSYAETAGNVGAGGRNAIIDCYKGSTFSIWEAENPFPAHT